MIFINVNGFMLEFVSVCVFNCWVYKCVPFILIFMCLFCFRHVFWTRDSGHS